MEICVQEWMEWKQFGVLPDEGDLLDQPMYRHQAFMACELGRAKAAEFRASQQPEKPELPVFKKVGDKWVAT